MTCQAGNGAFGVYCSDILEVAHFAGRRALSVRWDDQNAALLCTNHHRWVDTHEADKWAWVRERLGEEGFDALRLRMRERFHGDYDRVLGDIKAVG